MHTLLNNETLIPDFIAITEAKGHDGKPIKGLRKFHWRKIQFMF